MGNVKAIPRVGVKDIFVQEIAKGKSVEQALRWTAEICANHAASVFDTAEDVSLAVGSIDVDFSYDLESAVKDRIGPGAVTKDVLRNAVLYVVGPGGIAGIPTARCLHKYLPKNRKPTREEMEDAWAKCSGQTT